MVRGVAGPVGAHRSPSDGRQMRAPHFSGEGSLSTEFLAQARQLVRRPGGRIAFVMTPLLATPSGKQRSGAVRLPALGHRVSQDTANRELQVQAFEVTRRELMQIVRRITRTREAETLTDLARHLVASRLREVPDGDAAHRAAGLLRQAEGWRSAQGVHGMSASTSVRHWDPSAAWHEGDIGLFGVARSTRHGPPMTPVVGEVASARGHSVVVRLDGDPGARVFGVPAEGRHHHHVDEWRRSVVALVVDLAKCSEERACVDYVLWHCGDAIVTELLRALRHDARFMSLEGRWFLRRYARRPSSAQLDGVARAMAFEAEHPMTTEALLARVSPAMAVGDPGLFGLVQALIERPDLFANVDIDSRPRWVLVGPPPGSYTARYAAYDPETWALLCEPGELLSPEVIDRLWALGMLPVVVRQ
jgi:hypothetical protein